MADDAAAQSGSPAAAAAREPVAAMMRILGYPLALDRCYEPATHMWVLRAGEGVARIGMDPLGIETSGTLAQLSFQPVGTTLTAGRPFGQLEAAKFVGPLVSPVNGILQAVNDAVISDPGLAERDPFGPGWLIEVSLSDATVPGSLLSEPDDITAWFVGKVEEYQLKGVLAQ
ncbi:MAG: glycine cleavage system protein H [Gemmatimonadota bacterium]